jgi:DNA-3-methyladenine glycosylase II
MPIQKIKILKKRNLTPTKNAFQSLTRSIIYQQLSGKAAGTIYDRFVRLWPKKKFPTPEDVIKISDIKLRSAGLSRGKILYIKDLASKFLDSTIQPKKFSKMSDQEIIDHLTQVKGIGVWTAHMFLIFALNRPDILPTGDLAIRKGFMKAFGLRTMPSEKRMIMLSKEHIGKRTYLALHLWEIMDEQ